MVAQLDALKINARNGGNWSLIEFQRVLKRLEARAK
jgi:hypothetical protein